MSAEAQEAILTLEVAVGLVMQLAVGYQLLHAGETLSAAQRGASEEFAFQ